jgi:hypothetical protein
MSVSNIVGQAERAGSLGDESLQEVLDFLVTEEQLGVTLVSAAIENAPGAPSEAFLPVLRNGVTQEYHHVQALTEAGGKPLTTTYWFPDAALDNGGIGVFETLEDIETIEISLYLHRRQCLRPPRRRLRRPPLRRGDGHRGCPPRARTLRTR